jgi:hypothetical protein
MTQPPRLVEDGTRFEREVLASARLDAGSDQGLKRTLVAMGLGAATLSAATSTASAGAAAAGTAGLAAGGATTLLGGAGVGVLVKWVGLAVVVVGSGAAVSTTWVTHRAAVAAVVRASPSAMTASARQPSARERAIAFPVAPISAPEPGLAAPETAVHAEQATSIAASPESIGAAPLGPVSTAHARSPGRAVAVRSSASAGSAVEGSGSVPGASNEEATLPASAPETPPPASSLSVHVRTLSALDDEIVALDDVRASLARHDAYRALRGLDAYDQAFPASVLADEATVLRVDALVEQGDRAAAAALSRRFLVVNPSSPHAPHLRQVASDAHNP